MCKFNTIHTLRRILVGHGFSIHPKTRTIFPFTIQNPLSVTQRNQSAWQALPMTIAAIMTASQSAGCWFSHVRMCCIRSGGSTCPSGSGQVNRSEAASWVAPRRSARWSSHHISTNRPIARPRRRNRPTRTRASSSDREASAKSSVQSTTHSTSMRASSSPKPRVSDSSRTISRTSSSQSTDMYYPRPVWVGGRPVPQRTAPRQPPRCFRVVVGRRIPANRYDRKREFITNRLRNLAQLAADGPIDYPECQP